MFKKSLFAFIVFAFALLGCVQESKIEKHRYSVSSDGYLIVDDEKTQVKITGNDGINGKDGMNGIDGLDGINGVDGKDGIDGFTPYIGVDGNWWINDQNTGQRATILPLNISKDYIEIPPNNQIRLPLVFKRELSTTIEFMKVQVKYSDFNEFLNLESIYGTVYEMYGFQQFTVKAEIRGKVQNFNSGDLIIVLLSFGNEPIAFFGEISSNGVFTINDEIVTNSLSSDFIISNIFIIEP